MNGAQVYALFSAVLTDFAPVFVALLSIFVAVALIAFVVNLSGGSRG